MTNVTDHRTNGITLLPFPFCGGHARLTTWTPTAASISCIMCGAHFNTCTEAEAISAWNTRAGHLEFDGIELLERTCKREKHSTKMDGSPKLRCSLCGYGIGDKRWGYCPNCGAKVVEHG